MNIILEDSLIKVIRTGMKNEFVLPNKFANELNVSTKTIENYIKEINQKMGGKGIAEFIFIKKLGYKLKQYDTMVLKQILNNNEEKPFAVQQLNNPTNGCVNNFV